MKARIPSTSMTMPIQANGRIYSSVSLIGCRVLPSSFLCLDRTPGESSLPDLFQAKLAVVLLDNPVALAGGVFKFLAVHDLHCTTGVLDELLPLQNTSCQAHGGSICP